MTSRGSEALTMKAHEADDLTIAFGPLQLLTQLVVV